MEMLRVNRRGAKDRSLSTFFLFLDLFCFFSVTHTFAAAVEEFCCVFDVCVCMEERRKEPK